MLTTAAFLVILLVIQPVSAQEDCGEPFATSDAVCNFTQEMDEDLDQQAKPWFRRQFNDSWTWEHNNSLTWAFDPNLAFWAFFHDQLADIAANLSSKISVGWVDWAFPLTDRTPKERPGLSGPLFFPLYTIRDRNDGFYYPNFFLPYPDALEVPPPAHRRIFVENLTFVLNGSWDRWGFSDLPPEEWIAKIVWKRHELSDDKWDDLATAISKRLNASWYVQSCAFELYVPECSSGRRPGTVLFGLLILLALMGFLVRRRGRDQKQKTG
jgi:hypothetical protein